MSLLLLSMELQIEVLSQLDFVSRLRMSSASTYFQSPVALDTERTRQALIVLEKQNADFFNYDLERAPCYE